MKKKTIHKTSLKWFFMLSFKNHRYSKLKPTSKYKKPQQKIFIIFKLNE